MRTSDATASMFQRKTEEIEAEKRRKKQEREQQKQNKEKYRRRQQQEKLVAPFLLFLTLLISFIIYAL